MNNYSSHSTHQTLFTSAPVADSWDTLSTDFSKFHKVPLNVLLHFVTSPLGLIGAFSLIRYATKSSSSLITLTSFYLLSLLPIVPNGVFYGTAFLCMLIVLTCRYLKLSVISSLAFIFLGYILQDLSHMATGEETFQSTYSKGGHIVFEMKWFDEFTKHTYYLLPLCVHVAMPFLKIIPEEFKSLLNDPLPKGMQQIHELGWLLAPLMCFSLGSYCLDSKNNFTVFPGMPYFHRVLRCSLVGGADCRQKDLKHIRDWVMKQNPAEDKSSHWWFADLTNDAKVAFARCAKAPQVFELFRSLFSEMNYCVDVVEGMNEIYVSGPSRMEQSNNSDQVFYTRHVDGPWGLIPFVSVYRCIVGMDRNHMITTHFPLANMSVNACEGDVLAFDFNREVHYIDCDESKKNISDDYRVTLKLHYCVYPRVMAPLGWFMKLANTRYNMLFRALFLKVIHSHQNQSCKYKYLLMCFIFIDSLPSSSLFTIVIIIFFLSIIYIFVCVHM